LTSVKDLGVGGRHNRSFEKIFPSLPLDERDIGANDFETGHLSRKNVPKKISLSSLLSPFGRSWISNPKEKI
jgi:hypothetical protein